MKKIIRKATLTAIIFLPALAMAQSGKFIINAKIGRITAPAKAYLIYHVPGDSIKIRKDSAVVNDGFFSFKGNIPEPVNADIILNPQGDGLKFKSRLGTFYLEPGVIRITSPDSLPNAKVIGGEINAGYQKLQAMLADVNKKYEELHREGYLDATMARINVLQAKSKAIEIQFIKENPNSKFSLLTLKEYAGATPDFTTTKRLFKSLSNRIQTSAAGMAYAKFLEGQREIGVGSVAPDFTQADTSGHPVSLHDFRGKYVLVDFWASWCVPCRAENPNIIKVYNEYKKRGLSILGVSLDMPGEKDRWLKAIHDDHLTWVQVSSLEGWKNPVAQLYFVKAIPQNYLIDPDGKIVAKNIRGKELQKTLAQLMK